MGVGEEEITPHVGFYMGGIEFNCIDLHYTGKKRVFVTLLNNAKSLDDIVHITLLKVCPNVMQLLLLLLLLL